MEVVPESTRRPCSENDFKPAVFVCLCTLAYHKPLSSTMFKAHTYACRVIFSEWLLTSGILQITQNNRVLNIFIITINTLNIIQSQHI